DIPSEVFSQMLDIEEQVIALRGLPPNGEFDRALITPAELGERVSNDFFEDYTPEDARQDALVLAAFGLIEPDFDFFTFYVDLLSEGIAGFYDNETKEMVVVQGESFAGPERITYAHEYTHALQDQNYDFKNGLQFDDEPCEEDSERCAAIQALIEGDATVTELEWFLAHSTSQDQRDIQEFYGSYESPVFDTAPPFMQDDFIFPYNQGYEFVNSLFEAGGFPAVDAAYNNLPVSTEQILHPELYPNDTPILVTLPDLLPILGEGWTLLDENVMGEWYTYLILARGIDPDTQLDDDNAADAAAGWGGDAYAVYLSPAGDATALVMKTVWDTSADAGEFAQAFEEYASARFGSPTGNLMWNSSGTVTLFSLDGDQTLWVAAPDLATAQALLAASQP
ncbi:MAG: hypothetical protein HC806_09265, partial [Anaerolineae bacterium]|nr:hypothetical protein [Anaerolineae bacterium]